MYLTSYAPDSTLHLRQVGALLRDDGTPAQFLMGDALEMLSWHIVRSPVGDRLNLETVWRASGPLPWGDTIFVHRWPPMDAGRWGQMAMGSAACCPWQSGPKVG